MSTQPTAEARTVDLSTSVALNQGPYADVPTDALADSLEAQYDRGEALAPEMVFELIGRLLVAEDLVLSAPGE